MFGSRDKLPSCVSNAQRKNEVMKNKLIQENRKHEEKLNKNIEKLIDRQHALYNEMKVFTSSTGYSAQGRRFAARRGTICEVTVNNEGQVSLAERLKPTTITRSTQSAPAAKRSRPRTSLSSVNYGTKSAPLDDGESLDEYVPPPTAESSQSKFSDRSIKSSASRTSETVQAEPLLKARPKTCLPRGRPVAVRVCAHTSGTRDDMTCSRCDNRTRLARQNRDFAAHVQRIKIMANKVICNPNKVCSRTDMFLPCKEQREATLKAMIVCEPSLAETLLKIERQKSRLLNMQVNNFMRSDEDDEDFA